VSDDCHVCLEKQLNKALAEIKGLKRRLRNLRQELRDILDEQDSYDS
jgi:hypothetical protein